MQYFRLEQDRRVPYSIILNKVNRQLSYGDCMAGNYDSLKRMTVVQLAPNKQHTFPDVVARSYVLWIVRTTL